MTDRSHNTVVEIIGPFTSGEAVSTVTPDVGATYLAGVSLTDRSLTPIPELASVTPKGLFVTSPADADHHDGCGDNWPDPALHRACA